MSGAEVKYTLRQGTSKQYITLKFLSEDQLEIILPKGQKIDLEAFLKRKASLIERKRLEHRQAGLQNDELLLFGRFYKTEVDRKGEKYYISSKDNKIRVNLPDSVRKRELAYEYIRKWIKRQLREILDEYLNEYERKMDALINKVYIKSHKARWGSYSPRRNLNFSIKMAALPKDIIEYIIIHELAHTKEPRHNKKFWYIVEKFCPDYKERKQELAKLHLPIQKNTI